MSKETEKLDLTIEMLLSDNEKLQKALARLNYDFVHLEQTFNTVTGAKWVRKKDHPQITWVSLTDEERKEIMREQKDYWISSGWEWKCMEAIEAKLKEKNT